VAEPAWPMLYAGSPDCRRLGDRVRRAYGQIGKLRDP
jgi:hypothetical protein